MASPEAPAAAGPAFDPRPLIAHVIFRLGVGGLENGVVNLVNRLPPERFRHAIVCLTDYTEFRARITRADVAVYAIHKRPGHDLRASLRLYRLFRRLRPAIVHSRNLGWERVGIPPARITRIYNGVDTERFAPGGGRPDVLPPGFAAPGDLVIGTVGRMHGVKDQLNLAQAFTRLVGAVGRAADRLRLVMIGDGPLREACAAQLGAAGLADRCWLPGDRGDVPALMRVMSVFVLPSQAEGISNTVLEAMASGLPVVATAVGGNPELVIDGETGRLVPPGDPAALATALRGYLDDPNLGVRHGAAGRARARERFSLEGMLRRYGELYANALARRA
ncbi:MAG: glycosyltransferase [Gammaproteobacteria bacterium]